MVIQFFSFYTFKFICIVLDILTALPSSPEDCDGGIRPSPIVVIRSFSNKSVYDSPAEFFQQMQQLETSRSSPISFHQRHSSTPESSKVYYE
jgi:hypothetical protein